MIEYITSYTFLAHLLLSFAIVWVSTSLGKLMMHYSQEYQPIANLFSSDNSTGFNVIYRILFTPVVIVFASVVAYALNFGFLTKNIWLVAVYVLFLQMLLITIIGRWRLVDKKKFFLLHIISILLTYYIYAEAISKGIQFLLPDLQSVRTELWIIIVLFIYGIFRKIPEKRSAAEDRKNKYLRAKSEQFRKKYKFILDEYEEGMADILIAIMIYENFNRPLAARIVEGIVSSKTRYVMQVHGAKSDADSIKKTAEALQLLYEEYKNLQTDNYWEKDQKLYGVFAAHNYEDISYSTRVKEIYDVTRKYQS